MPPRRAARTGGEAVGSPLQSRASTARPSPCIPSVASRFIRPTVYRMALGTAKGIFEIEFEPIATRGIASMNGNTCQRGLQSFLREGRVVGLCWAN